MTKKTKKTTCLTNPYKIDEVKGIVKYTVKCHGQYFTGRAQVNHEAGDVFDVEKGKRLAKLRALLKMKRAQLAELVEIQTQVRQIAESEQKVTETVAIFTDSVYRLEAKLDAELGNDTTAVTEVPVDTL
jgi:DNA-binding XRE family transcriptional regulator